MKVVSKILSWLFLPLLAPVYAVVITMYTESWEADFYQGDSLFSLDEEQEDANDLEIESFKFDFDQKKEEPQTGNSSSRSSEEKPVEFSFFVNESKNNEPKPDLNIRKLKPLSAPTKTGANLFDSGLTPGNIVMHERFGKGQIVNIEGIGADKKAEIRFDVGGLKKLLLRFAKLEVIG